MKIFELFENHFDTLNRTGRWGEHGAGCIFLALDTKKIGLALRSDAVQEPNTLGTVGGALDRNKDLKGTEPSDAEYIAGTKKEVQEEVGYSGSMKLVKLLLSKVPTRAGTIFTYQNFLCIVPTEFTPKLNWESSDFFWLTLDELLNWNHPDINFHGGVSALLSDNNSLDIIRRYVNSKKQVEEKSRNINDPDLSVVPKVSKLYRASTKLSRYPGKFWSSKIETAQDYIKKATGNEIRNLEVMDFNLNKTLNITKLSSLPENERRQLLNDFVQWMNKKFPNINVDDTQLYDVLNGQSDFVYPTDYDNMYLSQYGYDSVYYAEEGGIRNENWYVFKK